MADISPVWIAVFGTLFGGAGLKTTEWWLNRNVRRDDSALKIRDELRLQIIALTADAKTLREELSVVENQLDIWKQKYWDLVAKNAQMQMELMQTLAQLHKFTEKNGS